MFAWWKVVSVAVLMVLPGGFFILAAYALTRAVKEAWGRATAQAKDQGQDVTLQAVLGQVKFRDTLRQMRSSLTYGS